jgi:N-methylhydantoinase A
MAEIVSLRCAVIGQMRKPPFEHIAKGSEKLDDAAYRGDRPVYFTHEAGFRPTPTYDRTKLKAGNRIQGPALIEEYASTTVVQPDDVVTVDDFGDLVIEIFRS